MIFQEIWSNFMNFHEKSWNLKQFNEFCSAGSTGSVWNLDPGGRIRIRKSANQKNIEMWKSENLKVWKCENLEIWKSESPQIRKPESKICNPTAPRNPHPLILQSASPHPSIRIPLRWAAWAGGVEIRRPRRGLHGVSDHPCRNHEEIFRLHLRLMPPT